MMKSFPGHNCDWGPDPTNATFTVGHAGADYGSLGQLSGYNLPYKFGIALFTGSSGNMNCSDGGATMGGSKAFMCDIYDEILNIVSEGQAPRLNCSACEVDNCPCVAAPNPYCSLLFQDNCKTNRTEPGLCYACVQNAYHQVKDDKRYRCSSSQMESYCKYPATEEVCNPVFDQFCSDTRNQPGMCVKCLESASLKNRSRDLGCSGTLRNKYCNYPPTEARCQAVFVGLCGGARKDPDPYKCFSCVRGNVSANMGCNSTELDKFCGPSPTCMPVLTALCAADQGNSTRCLKCLANKTHRTNVSLAACTTAQEHTFCNYTKKPSRKGTGRHVQNCHWAI